MIRTLLIANRGEVAGRIISTCQRIGIRTIAVFSEADRNALHVRMADEAVFIGPSQPSESYLNIDAILTAAKRTKADAIHPGYGFLAENAEFSRRVSEAGLIFVGPSTRVIEQMGSKVAAREICQKANVPTVPGSGALDDQGLIAWALKHGFPVMLKASAGGGGKGMRRIHDAESLKSAIISARRESQKAFGSDELYLEKALVQARHLEVQIFGDDHGNYLHLGVRECSLQRRHQKIIEESPPTNVSDNLIQGLTTAALQLAREVQYSNAGTVEFLVDGEDFYFLEMNTRLQVEHPVTEMVVDLDLVELQIAVAQGQAMPFQQEQISFRGHAIEARLTCEKPYEGFVPAIGTILDWRPSALIRCDSTLESGQEITPYYDSMVAKFISWGQTREEALRLLSAALHKTVLLGVHTNIGLLRSLLQDPVVVQGHQHTEYLESLDLEARPSTTYQLIAAAAVRWSTLTGGKEASSNTLPCTFAFKELPDVTVEGSTYTVSGKSYQVQIHPGALEIDGHRFSVAAGQDSEHWWVHTPDGIACLESKARLPIPQAESGGEGTLAAPMPGSVVEVMVNVGDIVLEGQPLIKLEAMKMEQVISSPFDGEVQQLFFSPGDQVNAGAELLLVAPGQQD